MPLQWKVNCAEQQVKSLFWNWQAFFFSSENHIHLKFISMNIWLEPWSMSSSETDLHQFPIRCIIMNIFNSTSKLTFIYLKWCLIYSRARMKNQNGYWKIKELMQMEQIEVRTRYPLDSLHLVLKINKSKVI